MKCRRGYLIEAYKSQAGWFLGTRDNEGFPNCRLTGYAKTKEEAIDLFFTREFAEENAFCNKGFGCLLVNP